MIVPGTFLESTAALKGDFFEDAQLLITEQGASGAVGFVVNKLFPRALNELEAFSNGKAFPLHDGGPVDREHLFFIHRRPDLIEGGLPVAHGIFTGGDFQEAVAGINSGTITEADLMIFIGYCGWDEGELEEELEEGSWRKTAAVNDLFFSSL